MSENEEIKNETKSCNCDKKELGRFLLVILGSFLGCLVALCLFSAVNKPQPPCPMPMMPPQFAAPAPHHHMDCHCHHHHGEFKPHKKFHHPDRPMPDRKDIRK